MMDEKKKRLTKKGHLFNLEVLIEGTTNGIALEKLFQLLNVKSVVDYNINRGIALGTIIDATIDENQNTLTFNDDEKNVLAKEQKKPQEIKKSIQHPPENDNKQILDLIQLFKENGTLVRISIVKGKGVKLDMPCRILNYDAAMGNVSVYHVDEKKVYLLSLNEIDDFVVN